MNNKEIVSGVDHNNRPWTGDIDHDLIDDLGDKNSKLAISVVKSWFVPSDKVCKKYTSYIYKHWLENIMFDITNHEVCYISNNQLKDAMIISGFNYSEDHKHCFNWYFYVSPTKELKEWLKKNNKRW